jgi:hypothetical protein
VFAFVTNGVIAHCLDCHLRVQVQEQEQEQRLQQQSKQLPALVKQLHASLSARPARSEFNLRGLVFVQAFTRGRSSIANRR